MGAHFGTIFGSFFGSDSGSAPGPISGPPFGPFLGQDGAKMSPSASSSACLTQKAACQKVMKTEGFWSFSGPRSLPREPWAAQEASQAASTEPRNRVPKMDPKRATFGAPFWAILGVHFGAHFWALFRDPLFWVSWGSREASWRSLEASPGAFKRPSGAFKRPPGAFKGCPEACWSVQEACWSFE